MDEVVLHAAGDAKEGNAAGASASPEELPTSSKREILVQIKKNLHKYYFIGGTPKQLKREIQTHELQKIEDSKIEEYYRKWMKSFQENPLYVIGGTYQYERRIIGSTLDSYLLEYTKDGTTCYRPLKPGNNALGMEGYFDNCKAEYKKMMEELADAYAQNEHKKGGYVRKMWADIGKGLLCFSVCIYLIFRNNLLGPAEELGKMWMLAAAAVLVVLYLGMCVSLRMTGWYRTVSWFKRIKKITKISATKKTIDKFEKKKQKKLWGSKLKFIKWRLWPCDDAAGELRSCEAINKKNFVWPEKHEWIPIIPPAIFLLCMLVKVSGFGESLRNKYLLPPVEQDTDQQVTAELQETTERVNESGDAKVKDKVPSMAERARLKEGEYTDMDTVVKDKLAKARFTTAEVTNVRGGPSDKETLLGCLGSGEILEILEWAGDPRTSLWGKIAYNRSDSGYAWINRKTVIAEYVDQIPIESVSVKWGGNLSRLCDGNLQSVVEFSADDISAMGEIVLKLRGEYLPEYLVIYSGNYSEAEYGKCKMVSEIEISFQGTEGETQGYKVRQKIDRNYDVNGLWIPLGQEFATDEVSVKILDIEGAPAFISDILLLGKSAD